MPIRPAATAGDPGERTADLDYETFASKFGAGKDRGRDWREAQAATDAGLDYAINYIPGIAYDHDPMHLYESEVIPRLV